MVEKHGQRSSSLASGRQVVVVTGLSVDLGVQAVPVAAGGLAYVISRAGIDGPLADVRALMNPSNYGAWLITCDVVSTGQKSIQQAFVRSRSYGDAECKR